MAEKLTDKKETKADILRYENQKKKIRLANAAITAGLGSVGLGAYFKHPGLIGGGVGASTVASYLRGKAVGEKNKASRRIKERYGVKPPSLFNPSAILPTKEKIASIHKEAIIGSLAVAPVLELINHYHHIPELLKATLPAASDIAFIPFMAQFAKKQLENATALAMKHKLGQPLNPDEMMSLGRFMKMKTLHDKAMAHPSKAVKYMGSYLAAPAYGVELGETAAKPLNYLPKGVQGEFLRTVKNLGLDKATKEKFQEAVSGAKRILGATSLAAVASAGANTAGRVSTDDNS